MKRELKLTSLMLVVALGVGGAVAPLPSETAVAEATSLAAGKGKQQKQKQTAKQKQANAKAVRMIRNGRYLGAREDGTEIDTTFCRNGKFRSGADNANSSGNKWFVRNAKFTKKGFTGIVAENRKRSQGGFTIAIGKRREQWLFGISAFDEPSGLGQVERSNAKQECATL